MPPPCCLRPLFTKILLWHPVPSFFLNSPFYGEAASPGNDSDADMRLTFLKVSSPNLPLSELTCSRLEPSNPFAAHTRRESRFSTTKIAATPSTYSVTGTALSTSHTRMYSRNAHKRPWDGFYHKPHRGWNCALATSKWRSQAGSPGCLPLESMILTLTLGCLTFETQLFSSHTLTDTLHQWS